MIYRTLIFVLVVLLMLPAWAASPSKEHHTKVFPIGDRIIERPRPASGAPKRAERPERPIRRARTGTQGAPGAVHH